MFLVDNWEGILGIINAIGLMFVNYKRSKK